MRRVPGFQGFGNYKSGFGGFNGPAGLGAGSEQVPGLDGGGEGGNFNGDLTDYGNQDFVGAISTAYE